MYRLSVLIGILMSWAHASAQTSIVVSGSTNFSIKYWAGTCEGNFEAPKGKMSFNPAKPEATVIDVSIPAGSFHTGNSMRDKDVKAKKYLNAAAHPQINFKSTSVSFKNGTYYADGTLTIKGVSKRVSLPFKATKKTDGSYAINSSFSLNRLDFNVGEDSNTMKNTVSLNISVIIK